MTTAGIEFLGVSKIFSKVRALDATDLKMNQGEFVSLIGPSGCGKTTLLRLAAGLLVPTTGQVRVNGDSPQNACRKREIGVAFQKPALVESLNAIQNVELTLAVVGTNHSPYPEQLLRQFGLGQFLYHYPHQLSGGMQQRVNIACALAHNPSILLLDEPFGALDELTRESMGDWLSHVLATTGQTTLFVTHSVEEAVALADKVVLLCSRPGRIVETFPICLPRPRSKTVRTQSNFQKMVATIREVLYKVSNGNGARDE